MVSSAVLAPGSRSQSPVRTTPPARESRAADAVGLQSVEPLTDRYLLLRWLDSRDGTTTLDTTRAALPASFRIISADDPRYRNGLNPVRVGRKSKGQDFRQEPGGVTYQRTHWLYLNLPEPLRPGAHYTLTGDLPDLQQQAFLTFRFDDQRSRSEAIHVNTIGYVPTAPQKFAYVSHWMGDLGPLSCDRYAGARFHLRELRTGKEAFSGALTLRQRLTEPDGGQTGECPNNNYTGADLYQCDFSAFRTPGRYFLTIDGIGASYPFTIGADIYRAAFRTVARGLYHQRCGTALEARFTDHPRAACHRPEMRPFLQTTDRHLDAPHGDGDPNADRKTTGEKRTIWGGWHDAGDWDREAWHLPAATTLLLAYELAPSHFQDGDLNIPESGNAIPDIIDEARWCIDYYRRLQRPDGAVSVGFYESSFPRPGEYSVTDTMKWYIYAEDPQATYRYATAAAHLALCLTEAGKRKEAIAYRDSARKAWQWAGAHLHAGDAPEVKDDRFNAASALFSLTGESAFQDAIRQTCGIDSADTPLFEWGKRDQQIGAWTYALTRQSGVDAGLKRRLTAATLRFADREFVQTAARRGGRYGYNWYTPMWWGAATEPRTLCAMVAHRLTGDPRYLAPQYTTCDYMLGGNPLNMVWVTGLGPRHPEEAFHPDSWHSGGPHPVPGIVPLGPYRAVANPVHGPWEPQYAQQTCYPVAPLWPAHELWFENRLCPPTNEFTVATLANAAAAYGYLCAPGKPNPTAKHKKYPADLHKR